MKNLLKTCVFTNAESVSKANATDVLVIQDEPDNIILPRNTKTFVCKKRKLADTELADAIASFAWQADELAICCNDTRTAKTIHTAIATTLGCDNIRNNADVDCTNINATLFEHLRNALLKTVSQPRTGEKQLKKLLNGKAC